MVVHPGMNNDNQTVQNLQQLQSTIYSNARAEVKLTWITLLIKFFDICNSRASNLLGKKQKRTVMNICTVLGQ